VNAQQAGYYEFGLCSLIACRNRFVLSQAASMPIAAPKGNAAFPPTPVVIEPELPGHGNPHCSLGFCGLRMFILSLPDA
jgi:hypothetical protein